MRRLDALAIEPSAGSSARLLRLEGALQGGGCLLPQFEQRGLPSADHFS
jgi:hypothetical protein